MKILVIEDEVSITKLIRRGLEQEHYRVEIATDGRMGFQRALEDTFHLILLDLMLPQMDGWEICRELRSRRNHTPILMLTALHTIPDRVRGLDLGADDYLPKPFAFPELLARVQSLLRRDKVHRIRVIQIDDLVIDTLKCTVTRGGTSILLTRREYRLLELLAVHEGRIVTRETIQEAVWQDEPIYSNSVDVYMGLLRKKIDCLSTRKLLHTFRGRGYSLRIPDCNTVRSDTYKSEEILSV